MEHLLCSEWDRKANKLIPCDQCCDRLYMRAKQGEWLILYMEEGKALQRKWHLRGQWINRGLFSPLPLWILYKKTKEMEYLKGISLKYKYFETNFPWSTFPNQMTFSIISIKHAHWSSFYAESSWLCGWSLWSCILLPNQLSHMLIQVSSLCSETSYGSLT